MTTTDTALKPLKTADLTAPGDDGQTLGHLWARHQGSLLAILREYYQITAEARQIESPYVGSGRVTVCPRRDGEPWGASWDVGCWCDHDCCGHLCGQSLTVHPAGEFWLIVMRFAYNY